MKRDIVHVLSGLGRGGIETWLMNIFRNSDLIRQRSCICLTGEQKSTQDGYLDEVLEMGLPIYYVPFSVSGFRFVYQLKSLLTTIKPAIVHSHRNYMSGFITLAGLLAGVPQRISHYHVCYPDQHKTPLREIYVKLIKIIENLSATDVLACSALAMQSYYGTDWQKDKRKQLLYYGIDLSRFQVVVDPSTIRAELGIPENAFVIGHVGRFVPQKNHTFLVDIATEVIKCYPNAYILLVGEGELRTSIEEKIAQLGLKSHFQLVGCRSDVPQLMMGAMDVFLLPSHYEGLPVTGIEVQAAGLPFVLSDTITQELDILDVLMKRVSLSESLIVWCDAILAMKDCRKNEASTLPDLANSHFDITYSKAHLERIYE